MFYRMIKNLFRIPIRKKSTSSFIPCQVSWSEATSNRIRAYLYQTAFAVLSEPCGERKAELTHKAFRDLKGLAQDQDELSIDQLHGGLDAHLALPDSPALPRSLRMMSDAHVPRHQQLGISLSTSILHSLAHIEMMAMNMYWDTLGRFAHEALLPIHFFVDFLSVANDEARHWTSLQTRLVQLGSSYGSLPVHRMLWEVAEMTKSSVAARIALVPMVQEAKGLDAGPRLVEKLVSVGDLESAAIVEQIVTEERLHVACGVHWFQQLSRHQQVDPRTHFHQLIKQHLPQGLTPPFNEEARTACGMDPSWYACLISAVRQQNAEARPLKSAHLSTKPCVVFLCYVWPEHTSSAAGLRTRSLIEILCQQDYHVVCLSAAKPNRFTAALHNDFGVKTFHIALNDAGFDGLIRELSPTTVIFDRFVVEEQYSSRVRAAAPRALRVLDTQDLHFLRHFRQAQTAQLSPLLDDPLQTIHQLNTEFPIDNEEMLRELAAIHRSDLTLMCSAVEAQLLQQQFAIPPDKLAYAPFYYKDSEASRPLRSYHDRKHFVSIGNWHHDPNVDAVKMLKEQIWPRVHARLPNAQLHIYGAYPDKCHVILHDPLSNFHVKGTCKDQYATLERYRALLAPLRFGAGLKGKISDAFSVGTPVVTTPIGAEGMSDGTDSWGGLIATSSQEFADSSVALYNDDILWKASSSRALSLLHHLFDFKSNARHFIEAIHSASAHLDTRRNRDYIAAVLWDTNHRSTMYKTTLLELKSKSK